MSDHGQERVGSNKPPISDRLPKAPPVAPPYWHEALSADSTPVAKQVAATLAYKIVVSRFTPVAVAAILGAGAGTIATYVTLRRHNS